MEMAAEADLPVLIHAGFAMQRIVDPLLPTVEAHPELRLILGHAAMVEVLEATRVFEGHSNVLFETSVVGLRDLYVLFRNLDSSRICFGSDIPYGDLPSTLYAALAAADAAGVEEEELPGILSGNIRRWFPVREAEKQSVALRVGNLQRIGTYMTMAILTMWQANPRARVVMGMAQASVQGKGPDGNDEELLKQLRDLLSEAIDYYERNEFPAAMARMRVAHDLTGLHVILLSEE